MAKNSVKKPARKAAKIQPKKTVKAVKPKAAEKPEAEKPKLYVAPPGPKLGDAPTHPVVHAKCKRGSDKLSEGQSCNSLSAENMTTQGSNIAQFRCTKCKYVWRVPMGGVFTGL